MNPIILMVGAVVVQLVGVVLAKEGSTYAAAYLAWGGSTLGHGFCCRLQKIIRSRTGRPGTTTSPAVKPLGRVSRRTPILASA